MNQDISKCNGEGCPLKELCYRFTSKNSPFWQSWIEPPYDKKSDNCELFWLAEGKESEYNARKSTITTKDLLDADEAKAEMENPRD